MGRSGNSAQEAYNNASAELRYVSTHLTGDFDYDAFKEQIDQGKPVLFNVNTQVEASWYGHTIAAYGYEDEMFELRVRTWYGYEDVVVGGVAVRDTWLNGVELCKWMAPDGGDVLPIIEGDVEWWPFVELCGSSWTDRWDWMIDSAVTLDIPGWIKGDANGDGPVDVGDLAILGGHYGMQSGAY